MNWRAGYLCAIEVLRTKREPGPLPGSFIADEGDKLVRELPATVILFASPGLPFSSRRVLLPEVLGNERGLASDFGTHYLWREEHEHYSSWFSVTKIRNPSRFLARVATDRFGSQSVVRKFLSENLPLGLGESIIPGGSGGGQPLFIYLEPDRPILQESPTVDALREAVESIRSSAVHEPRYVLGASLIGNLVLTPPSFTALLEKSSVGVLASHLHLSNVEDQFVLPIEVLQMMGAYSALEQRKNLLCVLQGLPFNRERADQYLISERAALLDRKAFLADRRISASERLRVGEARGGLNGFELVGGSYSFTVPDWDLEGRYPMRMYDALCGAQGKVDKELQLELHLGEERERVVTSVLSEENAASLGSVPRPVEIARMA